ncbi:MAG: hypothetical protein ACXWE9_00970 [Methylobacter sp.]
MTWTPLNITAPTGNAAAIASQSASSITKRLVHPWLHGIGEGSGHYRYLSFPNAAKALAQTIGTEQAALGIAIAAANLTDFAHDIGTLNTVFPLREFAALGRKAESLITLETDKFNLPEAAGPIAAQSMALSSLGAVADLKKSALLQQAQAEADAFDQSGPIGNLDAYQEQKDAAAAAVAAALDAAKANLSGGAGWRFYAEHDIANALMQNTPDHKYTLTAIMLFTGAPGDLALLKEMIA